MKTKLVTNNTSDINTEINVNEAWNIHKLQVPGLTYIWSEFQAWDAVQIKHRQQQHWQSRKQFGMTGVFLSAPRNDWWALLSHTTYSILLNHGPSQQKIWNIVDCQSSEKKIQNTQEIKRTLFNKTKLDKTCKFSMKASFFNLPTTIQQKTVKPTFLVSVWC